MITYVLFLSFLACWICWGGGRSQAASAPGSASEALCAGGGLPQMVQFLALSSGLWWRWEWVPWLPLIIICYSQVMYSISKAVLTSLISLCNVGLWVSRHHHQCDRGCRNTMEKWPRRAFEKRADAPWLTSWPHRSSGDKAEASWTWHLIDWFFTQEIHEKSWWAISQAKHSSELPFWTWCPFCHFDGACPTKMANFDWKRWLIWWYDCNILQSIRVRAIRSIPWEFQNSQDDGAMTGPWCCHHLQVMTRCFAPSAESPSILACLSRQYQRLISGGTLQQWTNNRFA